MYIFLCKPWTDKTRVKTKMPHNGVILFLRTFYFKEELEYIKEREVVKNIDFIPISYHVCSLKWHFSMNAEIVQLISEELVHL